MFDILIVDRDIAFCEELKKKILWENLGCAITTAIFDVEEAKIFIHKNHYDMIFLGIQSVDLEIQNFLKELKQSYPSIITLIMGEDNDYEVVRQVMKLGAYDYLLKKEISESLLMQEVEEMLKVYEENITLLRLQDEAIMDKLRQYLILRKNHHDVDKDQFYEVLCKVRSGCLARNYQMVYFRIDHINLVYHKRDIDHAFLRERLQAIIDHIVPVAIQHTVIYMSNHSGLMLLESEDKSRVVNIWKLIIQQVKHDLDMDLSISLSAVCDTRLKFFSLFENLLELHELRFYVDNHILMESEIHQHFHELDINKIDFHTTIVNKMSDRDFIGVLRILRASINYMKEYTIRPEAVKDYYIFILNNVEGNEMMKGSRNACGYDALKQDIKECESIQLLSDMVRDCFILVELWLKDQSSIKYRQNISGVIEYVNVNYQKKLNLKIIADHFEISESYVSRMFKNETGKNLIYFINEVKMRKAIEFLSEPDIMIKEVSSMVGMDDQFYFYKVFKKFYGVSPSEFRKKLHA